MSCPVTFTVLDRSFTWQKHDSAHVFSTGITQEMINETRASTERKMLGDIQELLRQGEEVNQQDSQGATLVSLNYFYRAGTINHNSSQVTRRSSEIRTSLYCFSSPVVVVFSLNSGRCNSFSSIFSE